MADKDKKLSFWGIVEIESSNRPDNEYSLVKPIADTRTKLQKLYKRPPKEQSSFLGRFNGKQVREDETGTPRAVLQFDSGEIVMTDEQLKEKVFKIASSKEWKGGRSRLNKKTRRSQRKRGHTKRR